MSASYRSWKLVRAAPVICLVLALASGPGGRRHVSIRPSPR
jgi:hypothetical protein